VPYRRPRAAPPPSAATPPGGASCHAPTAGCLVQRRSFASGTTVATTASAPPYTLLLRGLARSPTYRCSPSLPYTSRAGCFRLKAGMRQHSVQHRTGRSFGKEASARGAAPRRPRAGRRPAVTRRRAAIAAGRRRRRPLFFYAVTASVAGELAAAVIDMEALVLVFSLMGLFLCMVIF
jgi:hypothetical protein